jgi:hypothetical protein
MFPSLNISFKISPLQIFESIVECGFTCFVQLDLNEADMLKAQFNTDISWYREQYLYTEWCQLGNGGIRTVRH